MTSEHQDHGAERRQGGDRREGVERRSDVLRMGLSQCIDRRQDGRRWTDQA